MTISTEDKKIRVAMYTNLMQRATTAAAAVVSAKRVVRMAQEDMEFADERLFPWLLTDYERRNQGSPDV